MPYSLVGHMGSPKDVRTHEQQTHQPPGHTVKNVLHVIQEEGITTYKM